MLYTEERANGRKITWALPVELDHAEHEQLGRISQKGDYLERDAGRIFLRADGRASGTFVFQPRLPLRQRYEERGWGTNAVDAAAVKLLGSAQGLSLRPNVYTEQPAELLWLRYFTNGVGDDYLAALAGLNVRRAALGKLWKLPNNGVSVGDLGEIRQLLDRLLVTEDEGLTAADVVRLAKRTRHLRTLIDQGYSGDRVTDLMKLLRTGASDYFLTRANLHRTNNWTLAQLAAIADVDISPYNLNKFEELLSADLTVEDVRALNAADATPNDALRFTRQLDGNISAADLLLANRAGFTPQDLDNLLDQGVYHDNLPAYVAASAAPAAVMEEGARVIGADFGRKRKGYKKGKIDLPPFTRLRVEDKIRVVVVPGDEYRAEFVASNMDGLQLDFNVSPGGRLTIRQKVKFGWVIRGVLAGEVRLTGPALEKLEVGKDAKVYFAEGMPVLPGGLRGVVE